MEEERDAPESRQDINRPSLETWHVVLLLAKHEPQSLPPQVVTSTPRRILTEVASACVNRNLCWILCLMSGLCHSSLRRSPLQLAYLPFCLPPSLFFFLLSFIAGRYGQLVSDGGLSKRATGFEVAFLTAWDPTFWAQGLFAEAGRGTGLVLCFFRLLPVYVCTHRGEDPERYRTHGTSWVFCEYVAMKCRILGKKALLDFCPEDLHHHAWRLI